MSVDFGAADVEEADFAAAAATELELEPVAEADFSLLVPAVAALLAGFAVVDEVDTGEVDRDAIDALTEPLAGEPLVDEPPLVDVPVDDVLVVEEAADDAPVVELPVEECEGGELLPAVPEAGEAPDLFASGLFLSPLQSGEPFNADVGAGLLLSADAELRTSVAFRSSRGFGIFDEAASSGLPEPFDPALGFLSTILLHP